jgi:filamentous hemagglutinin
MGFISDIGAALGGEISNLNAGSPNRVAFDDEGNLMPGVVNPNSTEAQQRTQLYNQLRAQGMSPAQANQLVQDWVSSGGQAGFNAGVAREEGGGGGDDLDLGYDGAGDADLDEDLPTVTASSPVFDDEGNLMPGIVDPNASPQVQRQQIYNALIEQGLSPLEADRLVLQWVSTGGQAAFNAAAGTGSDSGVGSTATPTTVYDQYDYNNGIPPGPNLVWTDDGWQSIEALTALDGYQDLPDGTQLASLSRPVNTVEAKVRQAILSGDAAELRLVLGEATSLSSTDLAIAYRALAAMESLGAQNSALLASRYGVDWANRVGHIFEGVHQGPVGQALLQRFGSPAEAMAQIQRALEVARPSTGLTGSSFATTLNLQGIAVQIRGRVVDGIYKIGTIEKW